MTKRQGITLWTTGNETRLERNRGCGADPRSNPAARIVFVTAHNHPVLVPKGLATGALGYVLKLTAGDDLFPVIRAALRGQRHLSPTARTHARFADVMCEDHGES